MPGSWWCKKKQLYLSGRSHSEHDRLYDGKGVFFLKVFRHFFLDFTTVKVFLWPQTWHNTLLLQLKWLRLDYMALLWNKDNLKFLLMDDVYHTGVSTSSPHRPSCGQDWLQSWETHHLPNQWQPLPHPYISYTASQHPLTSLENLKHTCVTKQLGPANW